MANKKGYYHASHAEPRALEVLKENEDGTVNIGTTDGTGKEKLLVRLCPVAKTAKAGHFTYGGLPKPPKEAEEPGAVNADGDPIVDESLVNQP